MNRHVVSGLAAALIAGSAFATTVTGASAHATVTKSKDTSQSLAKKSSGNLVKSRAPQLHVSSGDDVKLDHVWSGPKGLQYSAYVRTFKGLAVYGGDFVVTTDAKGRILGTSVAQRAKIGDLSTKAGISAATARTVAKKTLKSSRAASKPTLVVDALGTPRLAWKVQVGGVDAHGNNATNNVYVDAVNSKVLHTQNLTSYGSGNSHYNGSVTLNTTGSGSSYSMKDPTIGNLDCRDQATGQVFTGTDDAWGDGSAKSKETGCVDALFAIQNEAKMLKDWMGRTGFKQDGSGWKLSVGTDVVNAFYCPLGDTVDPECEGGIEQVQVGHNQPNTDWLASLDVLGHENGHGIDSNTPGGISGGGTQEFVGDVFGTLNEAYANESSTYDAPDYTIGEKVNLLGDNAPLRYMYKPSLDGSSSNCYSSSTPNQEVHTAAGPGNHWFYLLAEGTNPTDGQPASPTCNSTTLTGVGVKEAGQIFYNAMLIKTANVNYKTYRIGTLTAAKNLYPGDCTAFNKVKAAWDAVSMPAQSGEPTCTSGGGTNTVTVTNPGNQTATVGTATSVQLTGSDTGSGQTLSWSATGLPAGLSINATTGLISGTPTTGGTYTVTATAKDSTNATGSTTFTITVSGGGGGGGSQLLLNPGFESGTASWGGTTGVILDSSYNTPHSGSRFAYFGGNGTTASENLTQSVSIPASAASATLTFWEKISTAEYGSTPYDTLKVQVVSGGTTTTKATYSNANKSSSYVQKTVDLSAYKGKTITVKFLMTEDASLQTTFLTDDTALTIS